MSPLSTAASALLLLASAAQFPSVVQEPVPPAVPLYEIWEELTPGGAIEFRDHGQGVQVTTYGPPVPTLVEVLDLTTRELLDSAVLIGGESVTFVLGGDACIAKRVGSTDETRDVDGVSILD